MRKFTKFFLSLLAMLMVTVSASAWKFTLNSPAEGEVEEIFQIVLNEPAGTMWVDEMGSMPVDLKDANGATVATYNMGDNFGAQVAGNPTTFAAIKEPGTYTMTIPAGTFHIGGAGNEEQTFTWTIKGEEGPAVKDYTVSYADGTLKVTWAEGTTVAATDFLGSLHPAITGYDGFVNAGIYGASNEIVSYVALPAGEYTLTFPAGDFTVNNVPNAAFSETFTVGGAGGGGNHEFDGEAWHEQIFKAGETSIDKNNIVLESEGVKITTVDGSFELAGSITTIPFGYNTYDEKELDWNNKCQFVVEAKDNISKIILVPTNSSKNAIAYASATGGDGAYENGVWEGKLAKGETLTLTASDGIYIKDIYVCYNGDDFDPAAGGQDEKGVITISYPTENQLISKLVDGGHYCTFTTNKEYAQVTIEIVNSNAVYDNLDKFPTRMVDNAGENSDGLHVGENVINAATPASGSAGKGDDWYFYKGDSYTMIVKGFVNMWDVMPDNYDAIAEVHFVGDGKEHVAESLVKLLQVSPADGSKVAMVNGIVTLEFDGPVTKVNAFTPGGMSDPTINYTTTPKADSDNKVWEINLGDRSGLASAETEGNPILEVDVTAEAADGIVILSDTRADRGLELKYELVSEAGPTTTVTLGTPVWSVTENEEIEASTESINIKFPNAENVEGTYTLEVSGTIGDKDYNISNVSGTGTIANGADIAVSLSADKGYNLLIGTITVKNGETVVYSTENGNYQLNFGTKAAQQGGDNDGVTVEAASISEGALYITVEGISSVVPELTADHYMNIGNVIVDGEADYYQLGMVFGGDLNNAQRITSWNLAEGNHIVVLPAGVLEIGYWPLSDFVGTTLYQNTEDITLKFAIKDGALAEYEELAPEHPTKLAFYDFASNGATTSLDGNTRTITAEGVTLTATGSNTYTVPAEGGNFAGLRVGQYVTITISSEKEIEKIEFFTTGTVWRDDVVGLTSGSFSGGVWTPSVNQAKSAGTTLSFKTPNDQTISKIDITFKGDVTTGINNAFTINMNSDKAYNLAGQRVGANAKGIIIMNGKKYMVK